MTCCWWRVRRLSKCVVRGTHPQHLPWFLDQQHHICGQTRPKMLLQIEEMSLTTHHVLLLLWYRLDGADLMHLCLVQKLRCPSHPFQPQQLHPVRTLNPLPLNSPARCTKDLNSNMYISYVDRWFGCTWALLNSTIILVSSLQRIVFHCCKPSPSTICLVKPNFDRDTLTYSLLPLAGCWETFLSSPVTEFCNQH